MEADAALHTAAQGLQFLQVVEANLRRRKAVRTDSARRWRGMSLPVYRQRFVEVLRQGTAVESVTLRPEGAPVLRDLLDLAPWRVWRGGLRIWQAGVGASPSTVCARAPELMSLRDWDLSAPCAPALVILDPLVHEGWRVGRPPAVHTLVQPRMFHESDQNGATEPLAPPCNAAESLCQRYHRREKNLN